MNIKKLTKRSLLFATLCCIFSILTLRIQDSHAQNTCIGQVYGTPGCPLKQSISAERPALCGDAILNADEECDLGRFNGLTNCTAHCKLLYCGDSIISPFLGEECEPLTEEVYAADKTTGELIVEIRFMTLSCGEMCAPPSCSEDGVCTGGCQLIKKDQCTEKPILLPAILRKHQSAPPNVPLATTSTEEADEEVKDDVKEVCGNGIVEGLEECDDGNLDNTDECLNSCKKSVCGNSIKEGAEECDDGNDINKDACSNSCKNAVCGDGIIQENEECDQGKKNSDSKKNACRLHCKAAYCGDGIIDSEEQCDDANSINDDSCSNSCKHAICGDGIVQENEECDLAKNNSDIIRDACRTSCKSPSCGDSVLDSKEECDDGNKNDLDSCDTECKATFCGDGIKQKSEICDDGNKVNKDNCLNTCITASCGDGFLQKNEECDNGKENSDILPDACRTNCSKAICGDFIIDSNEECDGTEDCTAECKKKNLLFILMHNNDVIVGFGALIATFFVGGIAVLLINKGKKKAAKMQPAKSTVIS